MFGTKEFIDVSKKCTSLEQIREVSGDSSHYFYKFWNNMSSENQSEVFRNLHNNRVAELNRNRKSTLSANYTLMLKILEDTSVYSIDILADAIYVSSSTIRNWLKLMDESSRKSIEKAIEKNYAIHQKKVALSQKKFFLEMSQKSTSWNELAEKIGRSIIYVQKYATIYSIKSQIEQNFIEEAERRFKTLMQSYIEESQKVSTMRQLAKHFDLTSVNYQIKKFPQDVQETIKANIQRNRTSKNNLSN